MPEGYVGPPATSHHAWPKVLDTPLTWGVELCWHVANWPSYFPTVYSFDQGLRFDRLDILRDRNLFHLNTEMVIKRGFNIFWWGLCREVLLYFG